MAYRTVRKGVNRRVYAKRNSGRAKSSKKIIVVNF